MHRTYRVRASVIIVVQAINGIDKLYVLQNNDKTSADAQPRYTFRQRAFMHTRR